LYGEDFIQHSIKSIDKFVDKIFIFWDDRAWGNVTECMYKGKKVEFPKPPATFDNVVQKVKDLNNPKVVLQRDHVKNNINQFTHFVNDLILPNYDKPDEIMFIEVDHVWEEEQLKNALKEFKDKDLVQANARPHELWRTYNYSIPYRGRLSTVFWNMKNLNKIPPTGRHAQTTGKYNQKHKMGMAYLQAHVHNLGFCFSDNVMYWKHMTAIGFSQKIGDSPPGEAWLDRWRNWDFKKNNKDLEISLGKEHRIPYAEPNMKGVPQILIDEMPEFMKERMARE
jgi:hypothetical protein